MVSHYIYFMCVLGCVCSNGFPLCLLTYDLVRLLPVCSMLVLFLLLPVIVIKHLDLGLLQAHLRVLLYPDLRSHKTCCLHTFCNVFLTYISNSVEIPVFYFECENLWQFCLYLVKFSIIYSMAEISFAL